MPTLADIPRRVRDRLLLLFGYRRARTMDDRARDEMRFHLEMATERNIRSGMDAAEAHRAALVAFGGEQRWREAARDEVRSRTAEDLARDVRYAIRGLARAPAFTTAVVATLALSIGATTAIFSVVNAVLLRPLPYPDPDRVVAICERGLNWPADTPACGQGQVSAVNYLVWHDQARSFVNTGAFVEQRSTVRVRGRDAVSTVARYATASLFSTLGARAALGRLYTPDEDTPGGPGVVVLSYAFWREQLGGDSSIVGARILLNAVPQTVIGVAAPTLQLFEPVDLWTPIRFTAAQRTMSGRFLRAIGRLRPGVTIASANREMSAIAARQAQDFPAIDAKMTAFVLPLHDKVVGGSRRALWMLLAAVGFLLLIACANVANLHLARAGDRQREIALRISLGAWPGRVVRQVLTESLVLSAAGGALGFLLAWRATPALVALVPAGLSIETLRAVTVDWRVLGFAALVTVFTAMLFGSAPAVHAARADVQDVLKEGGRTGAGRSRASERLRNALVIAEMSLALVLLAGAGLMARSLAALDRVNLGFDPDHLLTARIALPVATYANDTTVVQALDAMVARIRAVPGVSGVGLVNYLPLTGARSTTRFHAEGFPVVSASDDPIMDLSAVTPGYFAALRIPIVDGRDLDGGDDSRSAPVVVVSASLAHRFWPNGGAIGHYLTYQWAATERVRIVGVAGDVHHVDPRTEPSMVIYRPMAQFAWSTVFLAVRVVGDATEYTRAVRNAVRSVDPDVPLAAPSPMTSLVTESLGITRLSAVLFSVFGGLGLLLASIGIYGLTSYSVQRRRQEIGVRLALGATGRAVTVEIVRRGAELSLAGIVIGVAIASLGTSTMRKLLYGVGAHDSVTFLGAALLLGAVAVLACYLPARRAAQLDAMVVLRGE